jgi:hypothetical protein
MSFNACSHKISGLRSPALARTMIPGDGLFGEIVAVSGPQGDADHSEGNTQDAHGLGIEPFAVKIGADRHGNGPQKA